jgi:hypothetical protein
MAFVFHRRLAIPLWAIAFFTVALTAPPAATLLLIPPTTVFAIAAVGIAAIVFLMPGAIPWLRTSRALVRVHPSGHRDRASAAITMAVGTGVRTLDEPNRSTADDALDLVRMDDDGGGQMARHAPNVVPPPGSSMNGNGHRTLAPGRSCRSAPGRRL